MYRLHAVLILGLSVLAFIVGCGDSGSNTVQPAPGLSAEDYQQMEAESAASREAAIRDSQ